MYKMGFSTNGYSVLMLIIAISMISSTHGGNFFQEFEPIFGDQRVKIDGGQSLSLSLDKASGSGFKSKREYMFGRVDMQIKLISGNSAGTVTTYYLSSKGATWDEIDYEFLGNVTGQPYTIHTNIITQGKGNREQQFHLWFDPTKTFHTYSIVWKPQHIIFLVDNVPIRVFKNHESIGVPFPKNQPMRIYSTLWNADDWATQGGRVKTDWSKAPFVANYRNFNADTSTRYTAQAAAGTRANNINALDAAGQRRLRWVQKNYMIYNYCSDFKRFPQGLPAECKFPA